MPRRLAMALPHAIDTKVGVFDGGLNRANGLHHLVGRFAVPLLADVGLSNMELVVSNLAECRVCFVFGNLHLAFNPAPRKPRGAS